MINREEGTGEETKKAFLKDIGVAALRFTYFWTVTVIFSEIFYLLKVEPLINWSAPIALILAFYYLYCRRISLIQKNYRGMALGPGWYFVRLYSILALPLAVFIFLRIVFLDLGAYETVAQIALMTFVLILYIYLVLRPYIDERHALAGTHGYSRAAAEVEESFRNSISYSERERIIIVVREWGGPKNANARNVGIREPVFAITPYLRDNLPQ